jgi:Domain of unknown function DUF29
MTLAPPSSQLKRCLYERDFYAWTQSMAHALRSGNWDALDIENLVEEMESLGRQERKELENRLSILLGHLLKWQYQPENHSNSWRATLREQRRQIHKLLRESPSLQPSIPEILPEAYLTGRDLAIQETNLSDEIFPEHCPYEFEVAIDPNFFPQS